ncbi:sugar ABC transporter ATP-binding protein [Zongyangia hominis]|uniref:Ribose/galactose/methyl galactoside import ATP-binding protein n=1 Tax=Zongyangia hominis TaxID=2763677 RepID=A0A926EDU0_9FIRM|nr:sugar ABC transporter ATP-binding protein [Zongyangia hominis]MBC8571238.1 sugar ABC transporter ATP-binding protein [Zongyangia hominis]
MSEYRLEMEGIVKRFPGVLALDHASLRVRPASVHALVGENGAGKSTLMNCLFGIYKKDEGMVLLDGEPMEIKGTHHAIESGIAMIHQELNPIPEQNVQDNIWVGRYDTKYMVIDDGKMYEKTKRLMDQVGFDIDPKEKAKNLSVSELQAVEIAKAISYNAKIVVMDEPTSSLTSTETDKLFHLIREIREQGTSIIYISHKMEEIFEIADEVTIMRDGATVGTWTTEELSVEDVINKMVGRTLENRFPEQETPPREELMLTVENLTSANPRSFKDISFTLRRGEIMGIGGLVGAQRTEMVESLFGLRPVLSGTIVKGGKELHLKNPHRAIHEGFALLTEERRTTGILPLLSVEDNVLVANLKKYSNALQVIKNKEARKNVQAICKALNVKTPTLKTRIMNLSGGNQQKVLLGRWLLTNSNILILDEPTRGIDVGAKYEIYKIMRDLAAQGNSIIMVSSELPELLGMSDRILVMCDGRMTGILSKEEATQVEVMRLATQFT